MEIAVKRHRQVAYEKTSAVGKLDATRIEMDQPVCLKAFEGFSGILEIILKIKPVSAEFIETDFSHGTSVPRSPACVTSRPHPVSSPLGLSFLPLKFDKKITPGRNLLISRNDFPN